jgi:imidazolonepropionase-like amidohydrolase
VKQAGWFLAGALSLAALASASESHSEAPAKAGRTVLLKAGTVHTVDAAGVLRDGAVLLKDGKIAAVGVGLVAPPGAEVVDYGPDAVIVPGLVAASSSYGATFAASARSADPFLRAADHFDPYSRNYIPDLMGGVTSVYVAPARFRLIAGQAAVVKLGSGEGALLDDANAVHGTITEEARRVPGYWDPPIPATIENGLGVVEQQLPGSAMGAVMALEELVSIARGRQPDNGAWGPDTAAKLRELIDARRVWRIGADTDAEIRALVDLARREKLPLFVEGGGESGGLAAELAGANVGVVLKVDVAAQSGGRDQGKSKDVRTPRYDNAARLAAAGVKFAIAPGGTLRARDLRFAAQVASRGGLSADVALRAITLGAAEALGLERQVGSLAVGKDADVCVLSGAPMAVTSGVVATWVNGELAWKSAGASAVVIEAQEVHLGDGHVLRPGQVLLRDGLIAEVGVRVARPVGARVVRGFAAMPGMIDSLGFLGLDGSQQTPATDFPLASILDGADHVDRRVARAGVTTVIMTPRGARETGTPMLAYKPASESDKRQVVADPAALRLAWADANRLKSGEKVVALLKRAADYDKKWREYEEALKKWTPPAAEEAPEPDAPAEAGEKKDEAKDGDKKDAEKKDEAKEGDKKDADKKDSKKKGKEEEEADPLTGQWAGLLEESDGLEDRALRLRLELKEDVVTGAVRCDALSDTLVVITGSWWEKKLTAVGWGSRGALALEGSAKAGKFEGTLKLGETTYKFSADRESKDLPVAGRGEVRKPKSDDSKESKEPKGKPRSPGIDGKLEPFRRAMRGEAAIVVAVEREVDILACVAAFEQVGIKPVLQGADEAWRCADKLRGRVAGILLSHTVLAVESGKGWNDLRNRYADLAAHGIPLGFHSLAEEGAAELPMIAAYAVSLGFSPDVALRALTSDVATMMGIHARVGRLAPGLDADVLVLDGAPLEPATSVLKAFVDGEEVR